MANKKISDLDAAAALDGTELLELVQDGANVKGSAAAIAGLALPAVVEEDGDSRTALPVHAGNYTRFTSTNAKTYTFDAEQAYQVSTEFHARNAAASGDLTLVGHNGFTLNAPAGGSLVVPPGGTVTVKIVAADEADVMGVTVPA